MTRLVVHPAGGPLCGRVGVPSDKSIGHRALLFAALGTGPSTLRGLSFGGDNVSTLEGLRAMGIVADVDAGALIVRGAGLSGLTAPREPIDCGNSGTTMRLLAGVLAAQPFASVLVGDASLSRRPMMRVVAPLQARGARIEGTPHPSRPSDITAPLRVGPLRDGERLGPLTYESPVASAQVKSAVLLSGLFADGPTYFKEPTLSRDHTERLLVELGVPLDTAGSAARLDPAGWSHVIPAFEATIPGDLSAAAFLLAATVLVPSSRVTLSDVGVNPTRAGFLEMARDMGARVAVEPHGERGGEPVATLHASSETEASLRGLRFGGELVARAIDEIPILAALAARASGVTRIHDAEELRVKESDRLAALAAMLRAFGVVCEEEPDGLTIEGRSGPLEPGDVDSAGDHRIAMTATVLALTGRGPSVIRDVDCIRTSYPKFVATMRALGARIDVAP